MSPRLALVCLVSVPIVLAASIRFRRRSNRAYLIVRDRIGQTLSTLQEDLSGVREIQAFAREEIEDQRFSRHNRAQLRANLDAARIASYYFPVVELAGVATTAAVVGVGGWLVHDGMVTVGTVAAFVLLAGFCACAVDERNAGEIVAISLHDGCDAQVGIRLLRGFLR